MKPFARFALVFVLVLLALCVLGGGPLPGFGLLTGLAGLAFTLLAVIGSAVLGIVLGAVGLLIGFVAIVPLMIPVLVVLSPLLLVAALVALASRTARG